MSLAEYYDALDRHDWYFLMSDDSKVWVKGELERRELVDISHISKQHTNLFNAFYKHYFSGPAFASPKWPKPEKGQF